MTLFIGNSYITPTIIVNGGSDPTPTPTPTPIDIPTTLGSRINNKATVVGVLQDHEGKDYVLAVVDAVYRASEPYKWGPRDEDSSINNYAANDFEGVVADTCSGEYNTHLMEQEHNLVNAPAFQFARNACILSINNKIYHSCLPTVRELELIRSYKEDLDTYDPTLSEYPARSLTSFVCGGARGIWASNEISTTGAWADVANGPAGLWGRDKANASDWGVLPVFCIPLN